MEEKDKNTLIRKKFLGLLDSEEEQQFDKQAALDPSFYEDYQQYKEVAEVVIVAENDALKTHLSSFGKQNQKVIIMRWASVAATLLLLIGSFPLYQYLSTKGDLYGQFFDAYPNAMMPTVRDAENSTSDLKNAFYYYDRGLYEEASTIFDEYLEQHENIDVAFYYAITLMSTEQVPEASNILENVVTSPEKPDYLQEAKWYLALCYVKTSETDKALALLKELDAENLKFKRAQIDALIESLER